MSFMRILPGTGLEVSALGLGTVKLGRNQGVKYPQPFHLPDDRTARQLLTLARELGINLLDTAPAYGNSEERLGNLLQRRQDWVITTKVGEEFEDGQSHFDFSAQHTRRSVERSLRRLKTDYLDMVLIHSDGNDLAILEHSDCVATLRRCQEAGMLRAIGMSTKTEAGGIAAARQLDVVMLTYNGQQQDRQALAEAHRLGKGVLVKKALMSGHLGALQEQDPVAASLGLVLGQPGVGSIISGTLNPDHLQENVRCVRHLLAAEQGPFSAH